MQARAESWCPGPLAALLSGLGAHLQPLMKFLIYFLLFGYVMHE